MCGIENNKDISSVSKLVIFSPEKQSHVGLKSELALESGVDTPHISTEKVLFVFEKNSNM